MCFSCMGPLIQGEAGTERGRYFSKLWAPQQSYSTSSSGGATCSLQLLGQVHCWGLKPSPQFRGTP